jgi:hypothetical protein
MTTAKSKALEGKKKHGFTIEPHFVPRGSGNNPDAGKRDLYHKIKELGYVFPTREDAERYASSYKKPK